MYEQTYTNPPAPPPFPFGPLQGDRAAEAPTPHVAPRRSAVTGDGGLDGVVPLSDRLLGPPHGATPEALELRVDAQRVIAALPLEHVRAFARVHVDGEDIRDVAGDLGVEVATLDGWFDDLRAHARARFGPTYFSG